MASEQEIGTTLPDMEVIRLTLKGFIVAVWSSRKLIFLTTATAFVASVILALLLPKEFESVATLLVMPPPVKEAKDPQQEQIGLYPRSIGVQDYAVLLMQDAVLTEVVEKVNATGILSPEEYESLSRPSILRRKMEIEVTVNEKTAYGTKHSPALLLKARGPSPEIARALAQTWGEVAQEKSIDLYKKSKGEQAKYIMEQFEDVRNELTRVFTEQEENEAAFNPDEFKLRLTAMAELFSQQQDEYYKTKVEVDGLRKEVEALQARLAEEDRFLTVFNSPPATALFLDKKLIPPATSADSDKPSQTLGYWTEQVNPLFVSTSELLVQRQTQLAGKEERLKSLERSLTELRTGIEDFRGQAAKFNKDRKKLEKEETVFGKNFLELANRYQQAKIAEAEEETLADTRLIADAVAPDKKVAPLRSVIVLLAVMLALAGSTSYSLLRYLVSGILAAKA